MTYIEPFLRRKKREDYTLAYVVIVLSIVVPLIGNILINL